MPADDLGHFLFIRYTSGSDDPDTQTKIGLQSSGVTSETELSCARGSSETTVFRAVAGEEWWWFSSCSMDDGSTQPLRVMVPALARLHAEVERCRLEIRGWSGQWTIGVNAFRHSDHVSIVAPTHRPHVLISVPKTDKTLGIKMYCW